MSNDFFTDLIMETGMNAGKKKFSTEEFKKLVETAVNDKSFELRALALTQLVAMSFQRGVDSVKGKS